MKRFNEGQVRDQVTLLPEGLEGWAAGVSSFGAVESLNNLTPVDVYFGPGQKILNMRREIKRKTIEQRSRNHFKQAA